MTTQISRIGKRRSNIRPKGFSAITLLVIMLILGVAGAVTSSIVISTFESSNMYLTSQQAFTCAQAGLEWVNKAVAYVAGTARTKAAGSRVFFTVTNNTGATITLTGLTASWYLTTPGDLTAYYEQVRIDGGAFSDDVVWDYTLAGSVRSATGQAVVFNTGPAVTLAAGTQYEFRLYEFNTAQTGSGSKADLKDANVRVAFKFTPDSFTVGEGTFTITVPAVATTERAKYVSTATAGPAERQVQMASMIGFTLGSSSSQLIVVVGSATTTGPGKEDMSLVIENPTGVDVTLVSMMGTWAGARYYDQAKIGNTTIFSGNNPRKGSGDKITFSAIIINNGQQRQLSLNNFRDVPTGSGNRTTLQGVLTTIDFNDGSLLEFTPT